MQDTMADILNRLIVPRLIIVTGAQDVLRAIRLASFSVSFGCKCKSVGPGPSHRVHYFEWTGH